MCWSRTVKVIALSSTVASVTANPENSVVLQRLCAMIRIVARTNSSDARQTGKTSSRSPSERPPGLCSGEPVPAAKQSHRPPVSESWSARRRNCQPDVGHGSRCGRPGWPGDRAQRPRGKERQRPPNSRPPSPTQRAGGLANDGRRHRTRDPVGTWRRDEPDRYRNLVRKSLSRTRLVRLLVSFRTANIHYPRGTAVVDWHLPTRPFRRSRSSPVIACAMSKRSSTRTTSPAMCSSPRSRS